MVETSLHHTKTKHTFYHVPEYRSCQVISQWMQAYYAIKLLWVIVYYTPITSHCFNTEMLHTLYALLTDWHNKYVILSRQTDSDSAGT
jgi:hypothetical protein